MDRYGNVSRHYRRNPKNSKIDQNWRTVRSNKNKGPLIKRETTEGKSKNIQNAIKKAVQITTTTQKAVEKTTQKDVEKTTQEAVEKTDIVQKGVEKTQPTTLKVLQSNQAKVYQPLMIEPRLTSRNQQLLFWKFIDFVNSIGSDSRLMGFNNQITEYSLITISFCYNREELDFYEEIYWFLFHFIEQKFQKKLTQFDVSRINRIICFGHKSFSQFIETSDLATIKQFKPYPDFSKIFLKYPKGSIPAMLLDSRTYPAGWDHN